jgi:peptidoglycan/LPS O-acetylase OafA/YrhL
MLQRNYNDTNFITSLRAIAILFVFLIHSGGGLRELGPMGNFIVDSGKHGVQMFFIISGFTIFSQFFSEKYTLKKFLFVRLSRISIPYYPILIILFIYINYGGVQFNGWANKFNNGDIDMLNFLAHIFYFSPYSINFQNTIIGVEWTIGIEVFFYVLFGLIIHFKVLQLNNKSLSSIGISLLVLSLSMNLFAKVLKLDHLFVHWLPFKYGYMFFLGGLAYYFRKKQNNKEIITVMSDYLLLVIVLFFGAMVISSRFLQISRGIVELYFVVSTFLLIIFFNSNGKISFILNNKIAIFVGSISYSFYLIHFIVIGILPKSDIAIFDFIIAFVVTVTMSFAWYYLFENIIYSKVKNLIKKTQ